MKDVYKYREYIYNIYKQKVACFGKIEHMHKALPQYASCLMK